MTENKQQNQQKNNQNKNKYSSTVLLPKTNFPMRAGLAAKEPTLLKYWQDMELYHKMLAKASKKEKFILADGPPYANGNIHMGHALNKVLKDIIIKALALMGYYTPYVPGWDCHGLPIEQALIKEMKIDKKEITDIPAFRKKARAFAQNFVNIQREGFKRLGVLGDWDNPYLTMSPIYEGLIAEAFFDALLKGYVYKGKKAIYWCPTCETALADAETEYHDKVSTSIYLRFKIKEYKKEIFKDIDTSKDIYLTVWTTTPWTIPANMAAAVNADEDYRVMLQEEGSYIIAADKLADAFIKDCDLKIVSSTKVAGKDLVGIKYEHPLNKKLNPVINTDFVTMDSGVGIVHIAPGHGEDDFYAGLKWNLEIFCPVNEKGVFTKEAGEFEGLHIFKANPIIIERLKELGSLLKQQDITHSYPHCWRCKKPIIFRATEQWFMSVDKDNLRKKLVSEIEKVQWYPAGGQKRITSMVELRPDWCLSRQRFWGVPLMVFYCKKCGKVQVDAKLFKYIADRAKKEGSDFWFTDTCEQILPKDYACSCGSKEFTKEKDILDVWFDSGVSWKETLKYRDLGFPADVYLEGSDQHRGWFQTSLIASTVLEGKAPFKKVITHGMILDQEGKAMHKSAGNAISPDQIINKNGADILRLWVSFTDYSDDVRLSEKILEGPIDSYRKIRNTIRYALGNLSDYEPSKHQVAYENLNDLDKYMLGRLDDLIKEVRQDYKTFELRKAIRSITDFCILDLSSLMLDASKDRLYTLGANSQARRSAQSALSQIVITILKLLAPILSFTAEEAWQEIKKLPLGKNLEESIFLSDMPENTGYQVSSEIVEKWTKMREIRSQVLKALEEARQKGLIGSSLEAKVVFKTSEPTLKVFLTNTLNLWPEAAIVSQVTLTDGANDKLDIVIEHAEGSKCPRCWQWRTDIGKDSKYPDLCSRCAKVLEEEKISVPV